MICFILYLKPINTFWCIPHDLLILNGLADLGIVYKTENANNISMLKVNEIFKNIFISLTQYLLRLI